jgi:polysaccharide pyruvyl transferase WcaK-like protein
MEGTDKRAGSPQVFVFQLKRKLPGKGWGVTLKRPSGNSAGADLFVTRAGLIMADPPYLRSTFFEKNCICMEGMAGRKIYFFGEGLGKTESQPKKSSRLLSVRAGLQLVQQGEQCP